MVWIRKVMMMRYMQIVGIILLASVFILGLSLRIYLYPREQCVFESVWGEIPDRRVPTPSKHHLARLRSRIIDRINIFISEKYNECFKYDYHHSIYYN